ncbi:MAG: translation initiation factor IF-2 [Pseudomonadota bacterium]
MTETKTKKTESKAKGKAEPAKKTAEPKKTKTLSLGGKLEIKRPGEGAAPVRQGFAQGRGKSGVQVEVRRKRTLGIDQAAEAKPEVEEVKPEVVAPKVEETKTEDEGPDVEALRTLTDSERDARIKALQDAANRPAGEELPALPPKPKTTKKKAAEAEPDEPAEAEEPVLSKAEQLRQRELEELKKIEAEAAEQKAEETARLAEEAAQREAEEASKARSAAPRTVGGVAADPAARRAALEEEGDNRNKKRGKGGNTKAQPNRRAIGGDRRRTGKLTVTQALNADDGGRFPSLAAQKRARERERMKSMQPTEAVKVTRDVKVPDAITVQELANRMAERGGDVIKSLMKMGVMATINQTIDSETAELIVDEFGHNMVRVSESDVELGLMTTETKDDEGDLEPRAPIVTVMGHVDHGKTSLLDALRKTDVVAGEAGGITQHIGAYQVQLEDGGKISFIDTPGHAAFTEMRARGATVTDLVILVVAANDGIMPQTVEAINHAKAAEVPIIVAINKIDLPEANPDKVRQELLTHELIVESMGGDIQEVEVSAKQGTNLDKLEEAVLLQAEILELKANPERVANGTVIEAKLDKGRGPVATVLVQGGTLKTGDIFVAGAEWGRVRALVNDRGQNVKEAKPSVPVEILGLQGAPNAGDEFAVVESEAKAREISEFRQRKLRETQTIAAGSGSLEQMFSAIAAGEQKELAVVIKGDVHGSVEAIATSLTKLAEDSDEVNLRVLHSGVGAINESDVTLAGSTGAMLVGFNVRANPQARDMAARDNVDIRYYSIIYNLIDDVRGLLSGLLAPTLRETFLGNAEIREVFNITKVGKVAGCYVTEGEVRRGAKVRLLRDNVVIHEGSLKTLKRFKDEVKEVKNGFECGMAFEKYDDIKAGDVIECFDVEEIAREL